MTGDAITVDEQTPFTESTQLLADCRISAVPVLDPNRRVVGVVSEADLLLKVEYPDGRAGSLPVSPLGRAGRVGAEGSLRVGDAVVDRYCSISAGAWRQVRRPRVDAGTGPSASRT